MKFKELLNGIICAAAFTTLCCCSGNSGTSANQSIEDAPPVVIHLADCLTAGNDTLILHIGEKDFLDLKSDGKLLSEFCCIDDIYGDRIALNTHLGAYIYELPSGRLIKKVPRDKPIANVVFTPDGDDVWIVNGDWNTDISLMRRFDEDGQVIESIQTRLYGDLKTESDTTYIATNGLDKNGGQFYVYRLDKNFEAIDSMPLPEYFNPQKWILYQGRPVRYDGENFAVYLNNDTVYTISSSLLSVPVAALDFAGKKAPDDLSQVNYPTLQEYYKDLEQYIEIRELRKFGNFIFLRIDYNGKAYNTVYDCSDGKIVYNRQVDKDFYELSLEINGTIFCAWPKVVWKDKLLFEIPADVMGKLTGNRTASQGIAMLSIADFTNQLKNK